MKEYKGFKIPDEEAWSCGESKMCVAHCGNCIFDRKSVLKEYLATKNNKPKVINYEIF